LHVRELLTDGPGIGAVFRDHQRRALGLHDDSDYSAICQALDEIAPALWKLRRAAWNAAAGYRTRSKIKGAANAAKPQHDSFLADLATVLGAAFNYRPPENKPGADGKFPKVAVFVRDHIVGCVRGAAEGEEITDQGTDHDAVAGLLALTPEAIASQWAQRVSDSDGAHRTVIEIDPVTGARRLAIVYTVFADVLTIYGIRVLVSDQT
jgi:hypothetical protein